jgi:hypothetical protein
MLETPGASAKSFEPASMGAAAGGRSSPCPLSLVPPLSGGRIWPRLLIGFVARMYYTRALPVGAISWRYPHQENVLLYHACLLVTDPCGGGTIQASHAVK